MQAINLQELLIYTYIGAEMRAMINFYELRNTYSTYNADS